MWGKIKVFMCGLICGILILSGANIMAESKVYTLKLADYNILANGIEYQDDKFPALQMDEDVYIPLKKFCDITGVNFNCNKNLKQIELRSSNNIYNMNNNIRMNNKMNYINRNKLLDKEVVIDGKKAFFKFDEKYSMHLEVEGVKYVSDAFVFQNIASPDRVFKFSRDTNINNISGFRNDLDLYDILSNEVVVKDIPSVVYEGMEFIQLDFYRTNMNNLFELKNTGKNEMDDQALEIIKKTGDINSIMNYIPHMSTEQVDIVVKSYIKETNDFNCIYAIRQYLSVQAIDDIVKSYVDRTSDYGTVAAMLQFMSEDARDYVAKKYINESKDQQYSKFFTPYLKR